MLLDTEPTYASCTEIYLGERVGSAGESHCCVTPCYLLRIAESNGPKIVGVPIAR